MTQKLTDMQLVLLATACERANGSLLPPAASLGTQAARIRRAVAALIKRALASECDVAEKAKAWREDGERHIGVVITDAGRAVIVAEAQDGAASSKTDAIAESGDKLVDGPAPDTAVITESPRVTPPPTELSPAEVGSAPRAGTKQALVVEMLRREGGANLTELVAATGWLPHTTRAALTGLRKKGHSIEKATRDGATAYLIGAAR